MCGFLFLKKVCISVLKKEGAFSLYVGSGLHSPDSNRTGTLVCELEGQKEAISLHRIIIPDDFYSSKASAPLRISRVGGNALNEI